MNGLALPLAFVSLAIWLYMLIGRGGFWLARERDDRDTPQDTGPSLADVAGAEETEEAGAPWPAVAVVIPARNEAESIGQTVGSLLRQDYPGPLRVLVVDDGSDDGTAAQARAAGEAQCAGAGRRLEVLAGAPLPSGWTGKLWAVHQGILHACGDARSKPHERGEMTGVLHACGIAATGVPAGQPQPEFLLLTDADISHAPDNLRQLVLRARGDDRVLVSLMARLRSDTLLERALIPAFVLFFQMLYPFAWVNRRDHPAAAAAGGCMLVRRRALEAAGGIESIRAEIIDDCALGARMKTQGAIWLGLTERAVSTRSYTSFGEIRQMVARTAYAQLRYSPLWLAATLASLLLTFIAPPLLALFAQGMARAMGVAAWLAMALAYQPMLRFYRRSAWWGPLLPVVALLYAVFTADSAIQHWRGRGGMWKGRAQARRRSG